MAVCAMVLEDGGSEEEAIAALLHDAVEDQGGQNTLEEIKRLFGDGVSNLVLACTDADRIPKPSWKKRKSNFLLSLSSASPGALRIILADKLHNLQSIHNDYLRFGSKVWKRFKGGKEGTLWYYEELVTFFNAQPESLLQNRFLAEYEKFTRILNSETE